MEETGDSKSRCWDLVDRFFVMRFVPQGDREKRVRQALALTLLKACSSLEVAEEVVETVINNEEEFPAPATLRQYLHRLGFIEADVTAVHDAAIRAEMQARDAEHANWEKSRDGNQ